MTVETHRGNALHTPYDHRPDLEGTGLQLVRAAPCGWSFSTMTARAQGGDAV